MGAGSTTTIPSKLDATPLSRPRVQVEVPPQGDGAGNRAEAVAEHRGSFAGRQRGQFEVAGVGEPQRAADQLGLELNER